MTLTRSDLQAGRLQQRIGQFSSDLQPLTEVELQASLHQTLQQNPGNEVWLFAYGSLIWNPLFHYIDRQTGVIHGFHRRFCLWTSLGRGTPDNPGLMLGLDRGGSCRGIVYRVAADLVESELILVWRREMIFGSYIPRWIKVTSQQQTFYAIAFVINRSHRAYAGKVPQATVVQHLATASGFLGDCADYLNQTIDSLAVANIHDRGLLLLQQQVMEQRSVLTAGKS